MLIRLKFYWLLLSLYQCASVYKTCLTEITACKLERGGELGKGGTTHSSLFFYLHPWSVGPLLGVCFSPIHTFKMLPLAASYFSSRDRAAI